MLPARPGILGVRNQSGRSARAAERKGCGSRGGAAGPPRRSPGMGYGGAGFGSLGVFTANKQNKNSPRCSLSHSPPSFRNRGRSSPRDGRGDVTRAGPCRHGWRDRGREPRSPRGSTGTCQVLDFRRGGKLML